MNLENFLILCGVIHFGILTAGLAMTKVLNWKSELKKLDELSEHIIWTHGAYIWFIILLFGILSFFFPEELFNGSNLGITMSTFIFLFWGCRLVIQLFYFDATPYLNNTFLKLGYHGLTFCFLLFSIVYAYSAYVGYSGEVL